MADFNVDRCIEQYYRLEYIWFQFTKSMFKNYPYHYVLEQTLKASEEELNKEEKKYVGRFLKGVKPTKKISKIAEEYGIKIKGKMMICPFHKDTSPSLSFDNEKGVFNCFGCGAKGDVIEFKRRLMEKNGEKKRC